MATAYTLITGASSGIGLELAKIFARNNYNLILAARSVDKMNALKTELEREYRIQVEVIGADLGKPGSAENLFTAVRTKGLPVEILVNNAGFGDNGFFWELPLSRTQEMIHLNITTLTELTRLFLPDMIQRKSGKILNVASTAAFQPGPLMSVYYATKAYVLSFTEGLSEELKNTGVAVTALCPGPTESGFQAAAQMEDVPLFKMMKIPTSLDVAEYGYRALMNGDVIAVHGIKNKIGAMSVRFSPRPLVRKLVMNLQKKNSAE